MLQRNQFSTVSEIRRIQMVKVLKGRAVQWLISQEGSLGLSLRKFFWKKYIISGLVLLFLSTFQQGVQNASFLSHVLRQGVAT